MMTRLLIATQNAGKVAEYRRLLAGLAGVECVGTDAVGLAAMEVNETGTTFEANARLKALAYAPASGLVALADDSGLMVDALGGAPGVYSARYGGDGLDDAGRRAHLLAALAGVPEGQRGARFVCVIAIATPDGATCHTVSGVCEGRILTQERGSGGFGYDALFVPEGHTRTFAELDSATKNALSHRGRAARSALPLLAGLLRLAP